MNDKDLKVLHDCLIIKKINIFYIILKAEIFLLIQFIFILIYGFYFYEPFLIIFHFYSEFFLTIINVLKFIHQNYVTSILKPSKFGISLNDLSHLKYYHFQKTIG